MEEAPRIIRKYFNVREYPKRGYIPRDMDCIVKPKPKKKKGGLYLGSAEAARNTKLLKALNIRAVMTVAEELDIKYEEEDLISHLNVEVRDDGTDRISKFFDDCCDFIAEKRKSGVSVLVHCAAGISRSATIVIAYLMKKKGYSMKGACDLTSSKRGIVMPNPGFLQQLEDYQKKLSIKHKLAYAIAKVF